MGVRGAAVARMLAVTGVVLLAAGCALDGSSTGTNQAAARDLAMTVADPATGTTQEMVDLGSFLFTEAIGGRPWALFDASDFALFLTDGALAGRLAWSPTGSDYELTETRSVSAGSVTGSATVTIKVAFFTSLDASGTGVQITPLTSTASTAFSAIHSLTYDRRMSGSFSSSLIGVQRQLSSTSSFIVTDLNGAAPGFTINGAKNVIFTNTYADGRTVSGTLSETVNNVTVSAALQTNGTWLVAATGTISVDYSAAITQADGTTTQVSRTATITLNGQQTVEVDMDGTQVHVDMMTGEPE